MRTKKITFHGIERGTNLILSTDNLGNLALSVNMNGIISTISINSTSDILSIADIFKDFPYSLQNEETTFSRPTYKPTGRGMMVFSHNAELIQILYDSNAIVDGSNEVDTYESILSKWNQKHPENTDNSLIFVIFDLMDGSISRRVIEGVIKSAIDYQRTFIITYDFHTCRLMGLKEVADKFRVDNSVVSRTTRNVIIITKNGCITMNCNNTEMDMPSVFDSGAKKTDGSTIARGEVVARIKEIIYNEDSSNPYTDDAIVDILHREHYIIARRTVAKYRNNFLKIPSSHHRGKTL